MSTEANEHKGKRPIAVGTSALTKISTSIGIIAAMVLAVFINVLVARHYKRWDVTRGGLYTLSAATVETLRSLEQPIHIYVLLSAGDPLTLSLRHLLDSYRSETTRLSVEFTDPDRRPAEFLAVQQRYGIATGRTEDGKIVTDAAIVVVRDNVPHFITLRDLIDVEEGDELRRRPRLEQSLTGAIRSVISKEQPKACFAMGHGEGTIAPGAGPSAGGLGPFRESLAKNNFELSTIDSLGAGRRSASPSADRTEEPGTLDDCRVLILAGPTEAVPAEDVARYKEYVAKGGSVFLAIGPAFDNENQRPIKRGLDALLAVFGIHYRDDIVFELDPKMRLPSGYGETFTPAPRPHAITDALIKDADRGLAVVLTLASSLDPTGAGTTAPSPILVTSDASFGMVDFAAWSKSTPTPVPSTADHPGPLTLAFAAELPKPAGSTAPHGPRIVAVGSASVLFGANWQTEELRGTSLFVGSAMAWLAARPVLLDIPNKPAFTAGLRVSEEWLGSMFRYVVAYIPLATMLLGFAMYLKRRSAERGDTKPEPRRDTEKPSE